MYPLGMETDNPVVTTAVWVGANRKGPAKSAYSVNPREKSNPSSGNVADGVSRRMPSSIGRLDNFVLDSAILLLHSPYANAVSRWIRFINSDHESVLVPQLTLGPHASA